MPLAFKLLVLISFTFLSACSMDAEPKVKKELLIYCGITMIKPMKLLADEYEKNHPVKITISQGASQDLYDSIKMSKQGDLFLPGSPSYRTNNLKDGLLKDYVFLGYNRVAFIVQKGNPKRFSNDIENLLRDDINTVLGNPDTSSVGRNSRKILSALGIFEEAMKKTIYITPDSRRLVEAIKKKEADLGLNWYAVGVWDSNKEYIDIIELPKEVAQPQSLELTLLSTSKHPEEAKKFMQFASSNKGLKVFQDYGFLTKAEFVAAIDKK